MALLGPKQTLTVYSLVLTWSVLVFWAGFTFGVRKPGPEEVVEETSPARQDRIARYPFPPRRSLVESEEKAPAFPTPTVPVPALREPEMDSGAVQPESSDPPPLTVQIGAVTTEAEGRKLLARLLQAGHQGRIIPPAGSGGLYRVWVGQFATEHAAEEMEENLKSSGFSTYVRKVTDFSGR